MVARTSKTAFFISGGDEASTTVRKHHSNGKIAKSKSIIRDAARMIVCSKPARSGRRERSPGGHDRRKAHKGEPERGTHGIAAC